MIWYSGSIADAIAEAKKENKIILIYIDGTDDMSNQMTSTYNDTSVMAKLSTRNIVALNIPFNSVPYQQFSEVYPVLVIPSSFFIRGNGEPIEIVTGALSPTEFSAKIDKAFKVHQQLSAKFEDSSSSEPSKQETNIPTPSTSTALENCAEQSSSSQSVTPDESNSSVDDRVERAKLLIEAQKLKKETEEKEKEKNDEIERRNMGKAMQKAQQTKKDIELKEWAKNRAKEKEEERLAREKVKNMIAQDRAERAARYQMSKEKEQSEKQAHKSTEAEKAPKITSLNSNEARIQFRLPDGSFSAHTFSADASLGEARTYVTEHIRPSFSNFFLCTTFPRRYFSENNYSESLRDLELSPSAVLLILPSQVHAVSGPSEGLFSTLFWILFSPFTTMWTWLRSFWPQQRESHSSSPEFSESVPSTSGNQPNTNRKQPSQNKKEPSFSKREGNVFRINNQSDDDENNTWNGNSTQQM